VLENLELFATRSTDGRGANVNARMVREENAGTPVGRLSLHDPYEK
jgi:hypothetical protein